MLSQDKDTAEPTISIAMCSFNGADYLQEQLISIAKQTRLPNELVVCDDNSTDSTLQILSEFKKDAPFLVKIHRNKVRLGATKNFEKAISLCKGEIIALSDQDDVWLPHKLEKIEESFKEHPNAGYIFSNAIVVDEKLNPFNCTLWDYVSFTENQRRKFKQGNQIEILIQHNIVTGATMAFRKELRDWILPIPEKWVHDEWIALLTSAGGTKGIFMDESFIKYRIHSQQLIGVDVEGDSLIEQFKKSYNTKSDHYRVKKERIIYALDRLKLVNKLTEEANKLFEEKITHLQARQWIHNHSRWKRFNRVFTELLSGRYHRFSNGWKSVVKDLCL